MIVADTGPMIAFARLGRFGLLSQVVGALIIVSNGVGPRSARRSRAATQPHPPNPCTSFPFVRSVRFYGTEAAEIADAMLHALSLTLLATSASLAHPCGSYRSATQEGR